MLISIIYISRRVKVVEIASHAAARKILLRASYVPYYCSTRPAGGSGGAPWKRNHPGAPVVPEIFRSSCAVDDTGDFPDTFILPRRGWLHVYIQLQFYRLSIRYFILLSGCYLRPRVRFLTWAREREPNDAREEVSRRSYSHSGATTMPIRVSSSFRRIIVPWNAISHDMRWTSGADDRRSWSYKRLRAKVAPFAKLLSYFTSS